MLVIFVEDSDLFLRNKTELACSVNMACKYHEFKLELSYTGARLVTINLTISFSKLCCDHTCAQLLKSFIYFILFSLAKFLIRSGDDRSVKMTSLNM